MTSKSYYEYWGKAAAEGDGYHLLPYHSLDVAAVACKVLNGNPSLLKSLADLAQCAEKDFAEWAVFFVSIHDLGKFSTSFQNLRPDTLFRLRGDRFETRHGPRHDSLGFMFWRAHVYQALVDSKRIPPAKARSNPASEFWASAVTGHHGTPPSLERGLDIHFLERDTDAALTFVGDVDKLLLRDGSKLESSSSAAKRLSWWLAGLTVLCDWLGSNRSYFAYRSEAIPLHDYWQLALESAERVLASTELRPTPVAQRQPPSTLFGWSQQRLSPLQEHCSDVVLSAEPSLFILEDVTGSGKTEASLILANRLMAANQADGIYFALPTMATANAMYDRLSLTYRNLFGPDENPSLVLAHGARDLSKNFSQSIVEPVQFAEARTREDTTPASAHCNQWLADNRKKSLLADVGVGTIDQALLGILPSRHQSLRLLGLLRKVLIVDEVHACDAYMNRLLGKLLAAHAMGGGSAILLSASLPNAQRLELVNAFRSGRSDRLLDLEESVPPFPLVTSFSQGAGLSQAIVGTRDSSRRNVLTKFVDQVEDVFQAIDSAVSEGKCVCWIRNTVGDANEAFEVLSQRHPGSVDLFHARFAMIDRLRIEERVCRSFGYGSTPEVRRGKILVATQVVEQSLDIDFDTMISDLAPVDRLVQRAGRLRRHERDLEGNCIDGPDQRGIPTLAIFSPPFTANPTVSWFSATFPGAAAVYANHGQLWLTAKLLTEMGGFKMPEDARTLIEGVYANPEVPEALEQTSVKAEGKQTADRSLAILNGLKLPMGYGGAQDNTWWSEAVTPTRLGEETTTIYLAKWVGGRLEPWAGSIDQQWQWSAVQIRTILISDEAYDPNIGKATLDACHETMPSKGKWGVLVPLRQRSDGTWQGSALDSSAKPVTLEYDEAMGARVL